MYLAQHPYGAFVGLSSFLTGHFRESPGAKLRLCWPGLPAVGRQLQWLLLLEYARHAVEASARRFNRIDEKGDTGRRIEGNETSARTRSRPVESSSRNPQAPAVILQQEPRLAAGPGEASTLQHHLLAVDSHGVRVLVLVGGLQQQRGTRRIRIGIRRRRGGSSPVP